MSPHEDPTEPTRVLYIRVPDPIHRQAKAQAASEGRTLQEVIRALLEVWLLKARGKSRAA